MKRLHYLFAFVSLGLIALGQSTSGAMRESPGRALRRAVGEIEISGEDEANKLERYLALLSRHADDFDPSYDQDIELNARRQALFLAQGGDGNPKAFVPFAEVEKWQPTNETQTAIWNLIERTAQTYAALHTGGWMEVSKPLPSQLRSALLFETAFCKITNGWSSSAKEAVDSMRTWLGVRKYFSTTSVGLLPLRIRYIRKILGIETIWDENCSELSAGACSIMERLRAVALQDLASDPLVFSNQVVCCRMAQAVSSNNQFAARAEQLVTRLQDKGEKDFVGPARVFENEHSSVFAEQFRFTARLLWGEISENAYLAVVRDGKAARRAFIREIAALAHVGMDEAREMDRFYEFKTYEALGKMDE